MFLYFQEKRWYYVGVGGAPSFLCVMERMESTTRNPEIIWALLL